MRYTEIQLRDRLKDYIFSLEMDARKMEKSEDFEAMYLMKDIKSDLEEILEGAE